MKKLNLILSIFFIKYCKLTASDIQRWTSKNTLPKLLTNIVANLKKI